MFLVGNSHWERENNWCTEPQNGYKRKGDVFQRKGKCRNGRPQESIVLSPRISRDAAPCQKEFICLTIFEAWRIN